MDKRTVVFVAGAGLTGCLAALAVRRDDPDARIVVWEKNGRVGGVARPWQADGTDFLSFFPDPNPLARGFGLSVPVEPLDTFYEVVPPTRREPGVRFQTGLGAGGFLDDLVRQFPGEAAALGRFWAACGAVEQGFFGLKTRFSPVDLVALPFRAGALLGAAGKTWRRWLAQFGFKDPGLLSALEAFSMVANLPADRAAAPVAILALRGVVRNGVRPAPGFGDWLEGLKGVLDARGIEVSCNTRWRSLEREGGRFRVRAASGVTLVCDQVVSTVDTRAFLSAVAPPLVPSLAGSYRGALEMSPGFALLRWTVAGSPGSRPGQTLVRSHGRTVALTVRAWAVPGTSDWDLLFVPEDGASWGQLSRNPALYRETLGFLEGQALAALETAGLRPGPILGRRWYTPPGFGAAFGLTGGSMDDLAQTLAQSGIRRPPMATGLPGVWHLKLMHGILGAFFQAEVFADLRAGGRLRRYRYPRSY